MSTVIRNEISEKSEYYLPKHRYLELRHFCAQYYSWAKQKSQIQSTLMTLNAYNTGIFINSSGYRDPTVDAAIKLESLDRRMHMVEHIATDIDPVLGHYIFRSVTEEKTYEAINRDLESRNIVPIPCGRNVFYSMCRKFFWRLDKARD